MTTQTLPECSNCGHDSTEHLGRCHTDLFVRGSWHKCSCDTYLADGRLLSIS